MYGHQEWPLLHLLYSHHLNYLILLVTTTKQFTHNKRLCYLKETKYCCSRDKKN